MTLSHSTTRDVRIPGTNTTVAVPTRDLPSVGALLGVVAVGYIVGGVPGGLTMVAVALLALVVPVAVGFAVGQLALLALMTAGDGLWLLLTQLAFMILLTEPARNRTAIGVTGVTLVAFGLLVGVVWIGLQRSPVAAAGGLGLVVAASLYVTHRYERVRLGLVDRGTDAEQTANTSDTDGAATPGPPE